MRSRGIDVDRFLRDDEVGAIFDVCKLFLTLFVVTGLQPSSISLGKKITITAETRKLFRPDDISHLSMNSVSAAATPDCVSLTSAHLSGISVKQENEAALNSSVSSMTVASSSPVMSSSDLKNMRMYFC